MTRLPRIYIQGCSYHIVQRGNNREPCFYCEQDYATYLKDSAESCGVAIHAYVLMTNHVHILVTPMDGGGINRMMQSLRRKYVRYFNAAHQRTGTLWEGRFKSSAVETKRYQYNGAGREVKLITPHNEYLNLIKTVRKDNRFIEVYFKGSCLSWI
jgi:putative transposase